VTHQRAAVSESQAFVSFQRQERVPSSGISKTDGARSPSPVLASDSVQEETFCLLSSPGPNVIQKQT
jgi:hypothetical protein